MKLLGCSNTYLPIEIIEQILLLLPPNSIARWRSVSKQWCGLLSSPLFIRTQALQAQSVSIFTYSSWMRFGLNSDNQVTASSAPYNLHLTRFTYLMGSCNGLVLVSEYGCQTLLINPTTRHISEIPAVTTRLDVDTTTTTMRITLDGIGFDYISNDYKIVSVCCIYNRKVDYSTDEVFVHIYSVNDGAWKSCTNRNNLLDQSFHAHWKKGVFVGRCIHWLIRRDKDGIDIIVAFDVVEEKFCKVPNPRHQSLEHMLPFKCNHSYHLGVLAGCLCVSTMIEGYINVWVMKKYGIQESWTRIAKIELTKNGLFMPLCLVGQQNLVLEQFLITHKFEKSLVSYNLTEKVLKDVEIPADGKRDLDYHHIIPFAHTMVSPYGMRGEF